MVSHALGYSVSYQITSQNVKTDINDNDDSQSFETPIKNRLNSSYFDDTIVTATTPNLSKLPTPGKEYLYFQTEGKTLRLEKCTKLISLTKFMDTLFEI